MFNTQKRIKELEFNKESLQSHLKGSQEAVREMNAIIEEKDKEIAKLKSIIAQTVIDKYDKERNTRIIELPILDDPYEFLIRSDNCEPKHMCDYNTDGKERYFVNFSKLTYNENFEQEMKQYGRAKVFNHESIHKEWGEDIQAMINRGIEELDNVRKI